MSNRTARPGLLLVLSAPSGAGKTTIARCFIAKTPDAFFSISATTRAPRGTERDGIDYHFVTPERFQQLVEKEAFAEWAEVHGCRYGSLRSTVEEALRLGKVALFDIDVQGGSQIKTGWPNQAVTVFILPPSLQELERRLRSRSTDSEEVIIRRLAVARAEVASGTKSYDYLVVNDELDEAVASIQNIATYERKRLAGRPPGKTRLKVEALRRGSLDLSRWLA